MGKIAAGEDEVLKVMERYWEGIWRRSEDGIVPDKEMGDAGGCWKEVVEVLKCLMRGDVWWCR